MNYDFSHCTLCPRKCGADRTKGVGVCGVSQRIKAAKASLHRWEEPVISGEKGSGTVFFSGCSLKCCFCQNYKISHEALGTELDRQQLADIFLRLQDRGAHNINLVSGAHFVPEIINALELVKHRLTIPVVYNSGGYERTETIKLLDGYVDIFLPDIKYFSPSISKEYSGAEDYFEAASAAVLQMHSQQPRLVYEGDMLKKGLVIRHMLLPGCRKDSIKILEWIHENLPEKSCLISLMSQYTPFYRACEHKQISRRVTSFEYNSVTERAVALDMEGFFQDRNSASEEYIPDFDLEGLF